MQHRYNSNIHNMCRLWTFQINDNDNVRYRTDCDSNTRLVIIITYNNAYTTVKTSFFDLVLLMT